MIDQQSLVYPLSPLDHLAPHHHVPKLLYFASTSDPSTITATLRDALEKTIAALPIIAGTVSPTQHDRHLGFLAVQAPFCGVDGILSVNDISDEYDFDELRRKHFPTDAIPSDLITPDSLGKSNQVMFAQANLLRGGVLLVFAIYHCVMDETGLFNVIKVWSEYCRGGNGMDLVHPDWFDREPLRRGAGNGRFEDHPEYSLLPEGKPTPTYFSNTSDVGTAIVFFSDESLNRLKKAAMPTDFMKNKNGSLKEEVNGNIKGSGTAQDSAWISTNDAICALLWSRISSARMSSTSNLKNDTPTMFNMAVDGRLRLSPPIPPNYTGNVVAVSKAPTTFASVIQSANPSHIASAAQHIRKSLTVVDDTYIKDIIQMVNSVHDLNRLAPRGYSSHGRNVGCSSWAKQPYYGLEWGSVLGGKCERLRWRSIKTDGIFVIFPRISSANGENAGGLEVVLGLQRDHLKSLLEDEEFIRFAKWRCG